jgi:perosamine synthetase
VKPGRTNFIIFNFLRDVAVILKGGRELSFYFQTLKASDSILAIWYAILNIVGIRVNEIKRLQFLEKVQSVFKSEASFLFGSARSALYSILRSLEFEDQSEVILTGFTCDVVPNAVIQAGLQPVYADINPTNYGMSPSSLVENITPKTKAVVIQHTFGIPCDVKTLLEVAKKHSLYVIEDCAVSLGTKDNGQLTGTFGDAAIFSFELSKTITSCRGGLLLVNNTKLDGLKKVTNFYNKYVPEQNKSQRVKTLLQLGISGLMYNRRILPIGKYFIALMFKFNWFTYSTSEEEKIAQKPPNYLHKLSEEQTDILLRQWHRLPVMTNASKSNTTYYLDQFKDYLNDDYIKCINDNDCNLIRFPMEIGKRDSCIEQSKNNGVELGEWFTSPVSDTGIDQEIFQYKMGSCPVAEGLCSRIINLPLHDNLSNKDRQSIVDLVKQYA